MANPLSCNECSPMLTTPRKSKTIIPTVLMVAAAIIVTITIAARNADAQDTQVQAADILIPDLPTTPYEYANLSLPTHFTNNNVANTDNTPNNNPVTNAGATLGRVLFYDVKLSANNTTSCASCHIQSNSFSDPDQLSLGFDGGHTRRHSTSLANARYYERGRFFWDERAESLEAQALIPIQDMVEMGLTLPELETKIAATDYYDPLFTAAFGDETVTNERIALALAQFVRSMVSYDSKFDQVLQGQATFTASEARGRNLFEGRARCDRCHETDVQALDRPRNIGLDATNTVDGGVGESTGNQNQQGQFKAASLRNVAVSAPYMHDGRFETLDEVVNFYNSQIQNNPNLDNILRQNGQPRRLNLNQRDRGDIVAFLNTLTDNSFLTDPKFSDPFVINIVELTHAVYVPIVIR